MASSPHASLSPLPEFIHDAFIQIISTDDAVSEAALNKFLSPHVQETDVASSSHLSRDGFRQVVKTLRAQITDRKFVDETFVVATPADETNRTGAVAVTHVFTGLQDGKQVIATLVSVLRIKWVHEHGHRDGGRREVVTEAFITNVTSS
ncbi:hypothetical protein MVEN_01114300 [Mycena venus]|uniref:SnoaL-like domain-containing protein n=1 Tax=Mycena venus TaxID=2733690 RepID=A0A8H6Y6Q0_9AGAR|nr:hypothetical protein MVEN_01114300 [Mycena venus]